MRGSPGRAPGREAPRRRDAGRAGRGRVARRRARRRHRGPRGQRRRGTASGRARARARAVVTRAARSADAAVIGRRDGAPPARAGLCGRGERGGDEGREDRRSAAGGPSPSRRMLPDRAHPGPGNRARRMRRTRASPTRRVRPSESKRSSRSWADAPPDAEQVAEAGERDLPLRLAFLHEPLARVLVGGGCRSRSRRRGARAGPRARGTARARGRRPSAAFGPLAASSASSASAASARSPSVRAAPGRERLRLAPLERQEREHGRCPGPRRKQLGERDARDRAASLLGPLRERAGDVRATLLEPGRGREEPVRPAHGLREAARRAPAGREAPGGRAARGTAARPRPRARPRTIDAGSPRSRGARRSLVGAPRWCRVEHERRRRRGRASRRTTRSPRAATAGEASRSCA